MIQLEAPREELQAVLELLKFGNPTEGPLHAVKERLEAALATETQDDYGFPLVVPEYSGDKTRYPLKIGEVLPRMRAALPKGARVWARLGTGDQEVVIKNGWFGDRCVIRNFAWFNCYRFGTLLEESALACGNWFSYGSLPGINQEGKDWPERMAQAAWRHIARPVQRKLVAR